MRSTSWQVAVSRKKETSAAVKLVTQRVCRVFAPPPDWLPSRWAVEKMRISAESGAEPGRWQSIPYQNDIMDAFVDPTVEIITWMKSARVGYTKAINAIIAYHIDLDPCNILVVQPTVEDAEGYSKDEIAPMVRDVPVLDGLVGEAKSRDGSNTILKKSYPGGILYMVGANSPRGFRRISARLQLFDETDGYPASAGSEGDPIKLGMRRGFGFWNSLAALGSTPTVKGESHIEDSYEKSDKRRYFVPCPHCKGLQFLKWSNMMWPKDRPELAHYVCEHCGVIIEEHEKEDIVSRGTWIAEKPFNGHAGFHIWAAYSNLPAAAWGKLAKEFVEAKRDSEAMQVFTNTLLGETWEEEAEQPQWETIQKRQEKYESPAAGAYLLTAGVDVQETWIEGFVEGWAPDEESWIVDHFRFYGDTTSAEVWDDLSAALSRTYKNDRSDILSISITCIDSGFNTQIVYSFCRKNAHRRVYATKGQPGGGLPVVGKVSKKKTGTDPRPVRLFIIGIDGVKSIIYYRLQNATEPGPRYTHFHDNLDQEFFEGLSSERVFTKKKRGFEYREWTKTRPRNEPLDCKVLNYAALKILNPTWSVITGEVGKPEPTAAAQPSDFASRSNRGYDRR